MPKLPINLRTRSQRREEDAQHDAARQHEEQSRRDLRMTVWVIIGTLIFSAAMIGTVLFGLTY